MDVVAERARLGELLTLGISELRFRHGPKVLQAGDIVLRAASTPRARGVPRGYHAGIAAVAIPLHERPQRSSLFASMSNHIAKSVSWMPAMKSTATRTIVAAGIGFPMIRNTTSIAPSMNPTVVMSTPKT